MLIVHLKNVGNPDYRQDPSRRLPGVPNLTVKVATLADAGRAVRDYIEEHDLGMGNYAGGQVKRGRMVVARIAYNGRAFDATETQRLTEAEIRAIDEVR